MTDNLCNVKSGGSCINFTSWNIKVLNGAIKCSKVLSHLEYLNTHIGFLQETHLKNSDHPRLCKKWIGRVYHSKFTSKSRGVAIIINKCIQFSPSQTLVDSGGRYVIVSSLLYGLTVTLANIYMLRIMMINFIQKIFSLLPDLNTHYLIMGGDFNCALNPFMDRSSNKPTQPSKSAITLQSLLNICSQADVLHFFNPSA